jgi:riboflavin synthase
MFTGLIEAVGTIADVSRRPAGVRLALKTELASELVAGDSLAVNGVCLTVTSKDGDVTGMDVSPETLRATNLGELMPEKLVNLERPVRADGRFGGHFVQGHVDATGRIERMEQEGDAYRLTVAYPAVLAPYIVSKGSIAVDGISLTVASVDGLRLEIQIVPYTWRHTALHAAHVGDTVNLESDLIGKYVVRAMETARTARMNDG